MTVVQPRENKQKPPYLLGLLCLIPLIGAFVGIGLLLYGIIRYKDKALIAIGAFGILFTVAIYSWLFYAMGHNPFFRNRFRDLAQMELNGLIKDIEFYKLKNGSYPDSLPQVREIDTLAFIVDPLKLSRMGKDLYPQVDIPDSSKIGLIKPG